MAPKASGGVGSGTKKKAGSDTNSEKKTSSKPKLPALYITRPVGNDITKRSTVAVLSPEVLQASEFRVGEICLVAKEGQRGVAAIIQSGSEDQPAAVVQLAAPLRAVGGVLLGDRVTVRKLPVQPSYATNVTVASLEGHVLGSGTKAIEKLLNDAGIIMPGQIFKDVLLDESSGLRGNIVVTDINSNADLADEVAKLAVTDSADVDVCLSPPGLFLKGKTTVFYSQSHQVHQRFRLPQRINYQSVGGLSKEIQQLKETIEAPLCDGEFYHECGVEPPRGILLHGPPGTGKTMLLRCVANENDAHVQIINGPSLTSKFLGETEERLRAIFDEARQFQPSIILIDEIDSIAPSRDSDDAGEAESRVVATLLTLMDGVDSSGSIVVVATTNRPNKIDPALRRPGRFNVEVEIGVPDAAARLEILMKQVSRMAESRRGFTDQDIAEIAAKTHGYVGTDLSGLCALAVGKSKHRAVKQEIPLSQVKISLCDFEAALLEVKPSAMREIFLETPKVYWSDIAGQDQLKREMEEVIELPLKGAEKLKRLRITPPKGILLYGPPGCSKTLTAKALATESGFNFFAIKGPEVLNKYVGETERTVRELFRKAKVAAPSIIFIDEIDELAKTRDEDAGSSAAANVLITLLNEIDGVEELNGVVVVAATNKPHIIDSALIRSGRLDKHIYVAPPDFEARLQILRNNTRTFGLDDPDAILKRLAEQTAHCSGAAVAQLCRDAAIAATREDYEGGNVEERHFLEALPRLTRDVTPDVLLPYQTFAEKRGI
ncbi:AER065Cp [Eremothecium gossypii ATCC 10895]|uniref:AER065Cp n=1 Tax=Eremothecium gossypii (strain ATCC 10895 / CBS 109.51 / FGSC 9923 / NRRL Y-1056) TaxID=284811 RepID=Q757E8_EREGS|nr:AER065Cp [Eremothecium gossypii ATCC 10895]AAS52749.2 AER065Cp [Eremothecium gossypii ATCC 10895]AEY97055.1 FAER065Cp [Eremothecium gossypii FDAG1]